MRSDIRYDIKKSYLFNEFSICLKPLENKKIIGILKIICYNYDFFNVLIKLVQASNLEDVLYLCLSSILSFLKLRMC